MGTDLRPGAPGWKAGEYPVKPAANHATSSQVHGPVRPSNSFRKRISGGEPLLDAERLDIFYVTVEFKAMAAGFAAKADAILRDQLSRASVSIWTQVAAGQGPLLLDGPGAVPQSAAPSFIYYGRGASPAKLNMPPAASWSSVSCRC